MWPILSRFLRKGGIPGGTFPQVQRELKLFHTPDVTSNLAAANHSLHNCPSKGSTRTLPPRPCNSLCLKILPPTLRRSGFCPQNTTQPDDSNRPQGGGVGTEPKTKSTARQRRRRASAEIFPAEFHNSETGRVFSIADNPRLVDFSQSGRILPIDHRTEL